MTEEDYKLMRDYLDGRISPANLDLLNQLLENDAPARYQFRTLATLEEGLRDLAAFPDENLVAMSPVRRAPWSLFVRPIMAAAAGLVFGVFCTSAIWAASTSGRGKVINLLQEGFESGATPKVTGIQLTPGIWSGDYSEVITAKGGVHPLAGDKMLRFLRADHKDKKSSVGYISDLYRVVDLRNYKAALAHDDFAVLVEAAFASLPFSESSNFQAGITISALEQLPQDTEEWKKMFEKNNEPNGAGLAKTERWLRLLPSGNEWQKARAELRVPAESQFLVIGIHLMSSAASSPEIEPPAVSFPGQFVDELKVSLVQRPPDS